MMRLKGLLSFMNPRGNARGWTCAVFYWCCSPPLHELCSLAILDIRSPQGCCRPIFVKMILYSFHFFKRRNKFSFTTRNRLPSISISSSFCFTCSRFSCQNWNSVEQFVFLLLLNLMYFKQKGDSFVNSNCCTILAFI